MLGYSMGFDDHVINVDLEISFDLMFEDLVHQSLVCSACIFQAKWHDLCSRSWHLRWWMSFSLHLGRAFGSDCILNKPPESLVPGTWTLYRLACRCWAKGYAFLGHTLLRSMQLVHICHLPLAFLTMTMLVSHVEYLTSLIKLALRCLSTSSQTTLCRSSPIFLFFYDTGLT